MKKINLLLFIMTLMSYNSQAQDELTFKVQYKPETKYTQTMELTSQTHLEYLGSQEFLQKLKDKGIKNPNIINTQSKTESIFKTGKLTNDTNFPLTMEFIKTTSLDGKKAIPDGTLIFGHGSIGNMPSLDSIV